MFSSMFPRKPDKATALKQLRSHVAMFGAWVAVVRVTPYILHYFSDQKEELKFELWAPPSICISLFEVTKHENLILSLIVEM